MSRRAFTLIELLVVVAIISLLMSILLPALGRARENAKAAVCLSHLHNLGLAVFMYTDENAGWFPQWGYAHGGTSTPQRAWLSTMATQYGRQEDLLRCPSDRSPHWTEPLGPKQQRRVTSYASNWYLVDTQVWKAAKKEPKNRIDRVPRASATIFWVELVEQDNANKSGFPVSDHVHPETWWASPRRLAGDEVELERHVGKANYAMVDGHAEPLVFEKTYKLDERNSSFPLLVFDVNRYDPELAR